jgi:hypothetical protein
MTLPESRRFAGALARRSGPQPDAVQLADAVVTVWREIDAALAPIVGTRGLAALHGRSVYLASQQFAWLKTAHGNSVQTEIDFVGLRQTFMMQPLPESQAAATALLHTFHDLLASMVGASLTERLLHAIWDNPFGGHAAQDVSE